MGFVLYNMLIFLNYCMLCNKILYKCNKCCNIFIIVDRIYLFININKRRDKIDLVRWSVLLLFNIVYFLGNM